MLKFELKGKDFIALCDLLKATTLCQTGGHAKVVIDNEEVKVNGQITTVKRLKLREGDKVEYDGNIVEVSN